MGSSTITEIEETLPKAKELAFTHALATFAVATGMIGASLTAIGVVKLVEHSTGVETLTDELLAGDSLLFVIAAICSFISARLRFKGPWTRFQLAGDLVLLAGMLVLVCSCGFLVLGT